MLKTDIQKGLLVAAGVFAFAGALVVVAMHHPKDGGGQALAAVPASAEPAVIKFVANPEAAPVFEAKDLTGQTISPANYKGKVVLLNFWATWCPPCREEIPELISLQAQYKDRLQIIGVSEDDDPPEKVEQFAQKNGMNYPIVMATEQITDAYGGVPALPTNFVIDQQGRVMQRHTGVYPMDTYTGEVRALLGLPFNGHVETFQDTGEVFLQNAANATELPGVDFSGLKPEQKKSALRQMNAEGCTCGCKLTLAECRINDSSCPISQSRTAEIVKDIKAGVPVPPPPAETAKPAAD